LNKCRGCGAEIIWAYTEAGKRIPLDNKAEKRFVLDDNPGQYVDGVGVRLRDTYISHFATCPKAAEFRHAK
jgi:hypothetical protein